MVGFLKALFAKKKDPKVPIDRELNIKSARYVIVDTELSGLNEKRDSVIAIGAVRMMGATIIVGDCFYCLARPKQTLSHESVLVHGITPEELLRESELEEVLTDFLMFCGSDLIAGHFVAIDISFINKEMRQVFGIPLPHYAIDTFVVYRWLIDKGAVSTSNVINPGEVSKIYDIAKVFGIKAYGAHNALMDAYITAQVFQRLITGLGHNGITKIGQLLKIGDPSRGGDKCLIHENSISNL